MLRLTTAPTVQPVTKAEAKLHARILATFTADDTYIEELIEAASIKFEEESGYLLREAVYEWAPEAELVASQMRLPVRPVTSATIADGVTALVEDTDFVLEIDTKGIGLVTFEATPGEPVFEITAGAATALAKLAIKSLVSHWYNNREAFAEKTLGPVSGMWESIIRNYRLA